MSHDSLEPPLGGCSKLRVARACSLAKVALRKILVPPRSPLRGTTVSTSPEPILGRRTTLSPTSVKGRRNRGDMGIQCRYLLWMVRAYDKAWSGPREETMTRPKLASASEQTLPRPSSASANCPPHESRRRPLLQLFHRAGSTIASGRLPPRPSVQSCRADVGYSTYCQEFFLHTYHCSNHYDSNNPSIGQARVHVRALDVGLGSLLSQNANTRTGGWRTCMIHEGSLMLGSLLSLSLYPSSG
jgi:hypothetical protein